VIDWGTEAFKRLFKKKKKRLDRVDDIKQDSSDT
jgi:hypothetical protein